MKMNLISSTILHLLNFEKYSHFEQALREAAIANKLQVILLSEDYNPLIVIETRHETTIDEAVRIGKSVELGLGDSYRLIDVNGIKTYWGAIIIDNAKYYLFLVDNEDEYSAEDINTVAEIIELAMGMWKYTPERDAKAEFIKALIRGNKSLAYSLRDEADIKAEDIVSVFTARGIEDNSESEAIIASFVEEGTINVIKINEDSQSYGILMRGSKLDEMEDANEKEICISVYDKLKGTKGVKLFHVTGIDGVEGAGDGFRLIAETWSFVEKIFPYKRVFSKYEMVLASNCINIQVQGGILKKNCMDLLKPFRREGDHKGRQLLETLETFVLDAGMNSAKTSEFMGIHTNTVQYRLKKINDILGAEITGNRVIPGLTVALALRRMENDNN